MASQPQLLATYRAGPGSPPVSSLQPGELYVETEVAGGQPPRLWVGTSAAQGIAGNVALILTATAKPAPSTITINAITNPSPNNSVTIAGTAAPGCNIEIAILGGSDVTNLQQLTAWSPYDATSGTFSVTWWAPTADPCRVRVRMHDDPTTYVDSNLFAVTPPAPSLP